MKNKSDIQQELVDIWTSKGRRGTIVAATGVGKTRVGVLALESVKKEIGWRFKALVIVPTTNLRDNEWINEIKKCGKEHLLDNIEFECTKTAYTNTERYYDMVVLDEVHLMLSPLYKRVFKLGRKYLLALTATPPPKEKGLEELCPILHTITLAKATANNLVSDFEIFNIPAPLTPQERLALRKADGAFEWAKGLLTNWAQQNNIEGETILDIANQAFKNPIFKMGGIAKKLYSAMQERKKILYTTESKIDMAVKLIGRHPNKKWITFDKYISNAEKLCNKLNEKGIKAVVYHSNMNDSDREQVLKDVRSPETKVICTVDALNAGFDLPDIDAGIALSYVSSAITSIQVLGRTLRIQEGKKAGFFNFYVRDSQEEKWLRTKLRVMPDIKIHWPSQLEYARF